MDNKKFSLDPIFKSSTYESTPEKDVKVKGTGVNLGVKGSYKTDSGLKFSGSVTKSYNIGKVDFPGGSDKWNVQSKPEFRLEVSKEFGDENLNLAYLQFVDSKADGGFIIGKGKDYIKDLL
jgi:hypothetical protein